MIDEDLKISENRYEQIYVMNIYKNLDCLGLDADGFFFFSSCAKEFTVGIFFVSRSGNRKHNIFF